MIKPFEINFYKQDLILIHMDGTQEKIKDAFVSGLELKKPKRKRWDTSAIKEQKNKLIDEWNINKFIEFLKKGERV